MITNDHTAFQVSNIEKSIEFYKSALGLELEFKGVNIDEQETYAFLKLEGGSLELIQILDETYEKPKIKPPYCPHFAMETKNMGKTLEIIKSKGINIVKGPLEIKGEEKWVYIS